MLTILPSPAPGTLQVSYRAQGKWYDLRDNGAGVLKGSSPEYGVGTVNYGSGTVAVTVGALPDVGSEIVYAWGGKANYFNRSDQTIAPPAVSLQLAQSGITPESVTITWNDGVARTATDDGAGRIIGAATGTIHYQSGLIQFTPGALPAGGQTYNVAYTWGPPTEEEFHAPMRDGNGYIDVEVEFDGLIPGTVELEWNLLIETFDYISTTPAELQLVRPVDPIKIVRDDRNGNLKDTQGFLYGTVNYATGVVRFLPDTTVRIPVARYLVTQIGMTRNADGTLVPVYRNVFSHWEYVTAGAAMPIDETAWAKVRYRAAGTSNSVTQPFTASGLALDLTPSFAEAKRCAGRGCRVAWRSRPAAEAAWSVRGTGARSSGRTLPVEPSWRRSQGLHAPNPCGWAGGKDRAQLCRAGQRRSGASAPPGARRWRPDRWRAAAPSGWPDQGRAGFGCRRAWVGVCSVVSSNAICRRINGTSGMPPRGGRRIPFRGPFPSIDGATVVCSIPHLRIEQQVP